MKLSRWFGRGASGDAKGPGAREATDDEKVARFWDGQAGTWGVGAARHWTELPGSRRSSTGASPESRTSIPTSTFSGRGSRGGCPSDAR